MAINVVDLFCGCGGFSAGFKSTDTNIIFAADYNDIAVKTYQYNFPGVNVVSMDIANIDKNYIEKITGRKKIDVVIGGPPCSGLKASNIRGINYPENMLFLHFSRIIEEVQPTIFVIENIERIVTLQNGQIKKYIITHFENVGYRTQNYVMHAEKYGLPQAKRRSIFIGIKKDNFYGNISIDDTIYNPINVYDALSDLPPLLFNTIINDYVCCPKNEYQYSMRNGTHQLTEHFLLEPSSDLVLNRSIEERRIKSSVPSPDLDTRKKYRDQMHYSENRLLTIREMARLQSFPDSFQLFGTNEEKITQIGNAIPPLLSKVIANSVINYLLNFPTNKIGANT